MRSRLLSICTGLMLPVTVALAAGPVAISIVGPSAPKVTITDSQKTATLTVIGSKPSAVVVSNPAAITATIITPGLPGPAGKDGTSGASGWNDITGKPVAYPPATHNQAISSVTGLTSAMADKTDRSIFAAYTATQRALVTDPRFIDSRTPLPHNQGMATITGLDAALTGKEPADVNIQAHLGNSSNPHATTAAQTGAEPHLGAPDTDGKVMSSTAMGVRLWVDPPAATHIAIMDKINEIPADDTLPLQYRKADGSDVFSIDLATGTVTITGILVIK